MFYKNSVALQLFSISSLLAGFVSMVVFPGFSVSFVFFGISVALMFANIVADSHASLSSEMQSEINGVFNVIKDNGQESQKTIDEITQRIDKAFEDVQTQMANKDRVLDDRMDALYDIVYDSVESFDQFDVPTITTKSKKISKKR
jgi:ElaB/YqjD/DUF883 family membrane-anchored ribosome-binding protein